MIPCGSSATYCHDGKTGFEGRIRGRVNSKEYEKMTASGYFEYQDKHDFAGTNAVQC